MPTRDFLVFCSGISCLLWGMPVMVSAQEPSAIDLVVPPPRTITAQLKPVRPSRTVDIHFFDPEKRSCSDTFKVEASRKSIHPNQTVNFRSHIQRKCNGSSTKAPIPESAVFSVRALKSKKNSPDFSEKISVDSNSFSFSYAFPAIGAYQVSVVHHMNDVESHTVSFIVNVLPLQNNAPTTENTD